MSFECAIVKLEGLVVDRGINNARKMLQPLKFIILFKGDEIFSIGLYSKPVFQIGDDFFKPCIGRSASIASEHLYGGTQIVHLFNGHLIIIYGEVWVFIPVITLLAGSHRIGFDRCIIGHSIAHILNVLTDLAKLYFFTCEVIEALIHFIDEVLNSVFAFEVAKTSIQYLIPELGIFVCRHDCLLLSLLL